MLCWLQVLQREGSAPAAMMQDRQTAGLQGRTLQLLVCLQVKDVRGGGWCVEG